MPVALFGIEDGSLNLAVNLLLLVLIVLWLSLVYWTFADARLTVVPGAGLFSHEERPAEVAAALLPVLTADPTTGGVPVAGRWQGAALDGVGVFEPAAGQFLLRSTATEGPADFAIPFFRAPAMPIAGRWSFDSQ